MTIYTPLHKFALPEISPESRLEFAALLHHNFCGGWAQGVHRTPISGL
jgi:hypothetical protein